MQKYEKIIWPKMYFFRYIKKKAVIVYWSFWTANKIVLFVLYTLTPVRYHQHCKEIQNCILLYNAPFPVKSL